jgi:hypothetical protein
MDQQQEIMLENTAQDVENAVPQIEGENITFGSGFVMAATANQDLKMSQACAFAIEAHRDAEIENGGAMAIAAGNNMSITNGGATVMAAGQSATVTNGGSLLLVSNEVKASNSFFGLLLSNQTNLEEGSRVLLDTKQAIAFGAAFGVVMAVLGWLLRKKQR